MMKKAKIISELLKQLARFYGSVNYARCGFATDCKLFEHDNYERATGLLCFVDSIGFACERITVHCFGQIFYAGVRLYDKNRKFDCCTWCTSCSQEVDRITWKRFQEYREENGFISEGGEE